MNGEHPNTREVLSTDPVMIDTGDTVLHKPTGETWTVACVEGERLSWCGWPEGTASLADCTLIEKATPEERHKLLEEWAKPTSCDRRNDHRHRHAVRCLEQERHPPRKSLQRPQGRIGVRRTMSKIQAWFVPVEGEPQSVLLPMKDYMRHLTDTYFPGRTLDFTKVRFKGRLCTMAVDDTGMCDGLPVNSVATEAYHANCKPGTVYAIHGPAVIFGGLLP